MEHIISPGEALIVRGGAVAVLCGILGGAIIAVGEAVVARCGPRDSLVKPRLSLVEP